MGTKRCKRNVKELDLCGARRGCVRLRGKLGSDAREGPAGMTARAVGVLCHGTCHGTRGSPTPTIIPLILYIV